MNRRQSIKAETRELILTATKQILAEKGITYCTMREVATAAGVSPASIVVHFKNKSGLIEAALYEDIERNIVKAIATLPEELPLLDRVMHIWSAMFRFYNSDRSLYRELIRNTTFEPDEESPHIKEQIDRFLDFLTTLVKEEQAAGKIDVALDALLVAESLGAFYFGMLIRFMRDTGMTPEMASGNLAKLTGQYLTAIASQSGSGGGHGAN